jgi:hypothetical protein
MSTGKDAAPITKYVGAITMGAVIKDQDTIDPQTKIPMCMQEVTEHKCASLSVGGVLKSPNHVHPLAIMMGDEIKNNMARLGTMYGVMNDFETDSSPIDP